MSAGSQVVQRRKLRSLAIKRIVDVIVSSIALTLAAPILVVIGVLIKLDSRGPVIFCQTRIGQDDTEFTIYKFRTMKAGTPDLATDQIANFPSPVTRLGGILRRTSLDELPQLVNVLKGQMSLVGPRPALYNQSDLIAARKEVGANRMLPGITGWAQVNGRDELIVAEKVAFDKWYVENFSICLDLLIIFKTVAAVVTRRGAR